MYGQYYAQFAGETFVIQAEGAAVENTEILRAVLRGMEELRQHGIRTLFVFGKGPRFAAELKQEFGVGPHPETNRLIIPELALPRLEQERARIIRSLEEICAAEHIPLHVIGPSAVRVERRIGHGSTGVPAYFELHEIRTTLRTRATGSDRLRRRGRRWRLPARPFRVAGS